jgi:hypothetical protein
MRDEVPTGTICEKIVQIDEGDQNSLVEFSNPHLAALAEDYAERILSSTFEPDESD